MISPLLKTAAISACLIAGIAPHSFAQINEGGWQALESFDPDRVSPDASAPSSDGWIELDSSFTATPPSENPLTGDSWTVIEDELAASSASMIAPNTTLAAGELVDITVANVDSLSGAYRISTLGTLVLPLIGSVDVAGLSAQELETRLEQLYGVDYLVDPEITVGTRDKIIGDTQLKGLINRPGTISMTSVKSLADILTEGGGVNGDPAQLEAIILRDVGIGIKARRVTLERINQIETPGPTILPGDIITIAKRSEPYVIKAESEKYPLLNHVLNGGSLTRF